MMKNFFRVFFFIIILFSLVSCHKQEEEITTSVDEIIQIHDDVLSLLNNQCQNGTNVETALNNCIELIQSYSNVSSAYLEDNQIVINYPSGVTSIIFFVPETNTPPKSNNGFLPKKTSNFNQKALSKNEDEDNIITNHKVLIWSPFDDEDVAHSADAIFSVFYNANQSPDLNFDIDMRTNQDCDVASLEDITYHGFVYMVTHGCSYTNVFGKKFVSILTREEVKKGVDLSVNDGKIVVRKVKYTNVQYVTDFNNTQVEFQFDGDNYAVTNNFFSNNSLFSHYGLRFDKASVVIVAACQGMKNSALSDAFVNNLGVGAFLGYNDNVTKEFTKESSEQFTKNMLEKRKNAYNSYLSINPIIDPYYYSTVDTGTFFSFTSWLPVFIPHQPAEFLYAGIKNSSAPKYFTEVDDGSLGQLICNDGRKYQLHSCHYSPGGSLTFLHSNADGEPSYVMAFFSLTMCNTALGNLHSLKPNTTDEWMNLNSTDPLGFWVKSPCTDVSSRLSIAGGGSIKMTDGAVTYNSSAGFSFWFMDEDGHRWEGTYNGPVS